MDKTIEKRQTASAPDVSAWIRQKGPEPGQLSGFRSFSALLFNKSRKSTASIANIRLTFIILLRVCHASSLLTGVRSLHHSVFKNIVISQQLFNHSSLNHMKQRLL